MSGVAWEVQTELPADWRDWLLSIVRSAMLFLPKSMPNLLGDLEVRLNARLVLIDAAHQRFMATGKGNWKRIDINAFQEGLVSTLWQAWNHFCRSALVLSARGSTTKSGAPVTSPFSHVTEGELLYAARQFANQQNVVPGKSITDSRQEPTWGDLVKLGRIINGITPTNAAQLLTIPTAVFLNDLQLCRNATAHVNADRIADVNASRVRYTSTDYRHPTDMIHWRDPKTNQTVWERWMLEIRTVANLAVA
jgi:hypothetical protein